MPEIHPTAVVEPQAQLADDVTVGPMCYVGPNVVIGSGSRLVSHVSVLGRTTLGAGNTIWPQAALGAEPQDLKYRGEQTELTIGDHNEIRECVTAHIGTENGGGVTRVGDSNLIMAYSHIGHDCRIANHCIIANAVQMAGHIHIEDHANIGGATAIHHYVTIGQYAFVGGMTRVVHDVPPFMLVEGNPARVRSANIVGLRRNRFPQQTIRLLKDAYRRLYRNGSHSEGEGGNMADALNQLEVEHPDEECVAILARFIRNTVIGMHGRYREGFRPDNRYQNPTK